MKTILLFAFITLGFSSINFGQNTPDQNPNYKKSMDKYMEMKDSSHIFMSSTIHNVYKVVDWAEEKQKQKDLKKERKHELKKMRIEANNQNQRYRYRRNYNPYYYNNYDNYNYNNPSYNNYGYSNGYNYGISSDLFILGSMLYLFNH